MGAMPLTNETRRYDVPRTQRDDGLMPRIRQVWQAPGQLRQRVFALDCCQCHFRLEGR